MTDPRPYTEAEYIADWKREIKNGASGRPPVLTIENGKASIRSISAPIDSPDYKPQKNGEAE